MVNDSLLEPPPSAIPSFPCYPSTTTSLYTVAVKKKQTTGVTVAWNYVLILNVSLTNKIYMSFHMKLGKVCHQQTDAMIPEGILNLTIFFCNTNGDIMVTAQTSCNKAYVNSSKT